MKTILLVEDNDDIRELNCALLRREGYTVQEAENGEAALEILQQLPENPCLVLLDLMMPVMSGPEFLKVLHESDRLDTLPIVVLSAGGRPTDAPGAKRFMCKPVDPRVLVTVVRDICGPA